MTETVRTHIILPKALLTRIDEQVGPRGRSEFVAETLQKELDRRRLLELMDAAMEEARERGNEGDPPEWDTPEGTLGWVRAMRRGGDDPWTAQSENA